MPLSSSSQGFLKPNPNPLLDDFVSLRPCLSFKRRDTPELQKHYQISSTKQSVLNHFQDRRALKIISGLQNFNKDHVASVIAAADKGGATHVDIACDPELVKLAISLTSCPVCVSCVDPVTFPAAVEAGALMIGNYDSFYAKGVVFTPEQVKLAEAIEQGGAGIIQTGGGKCCNPTKSGVLGLIEKATPTLAAYSISRAVNIPVMCSSGLSAVTMAITAGVGTVSAVISILRSDLLQLKGRLIDSS